MIWNPICKNAVFNVIFRGQFIRTCFYLLPKNAQHFSQKGSKGQVALSGSLRAAPSRNLQFVSAKRAVGEIAGNPAAAVWAAASRAIALHALQLIKVDHSGCKHLISGFLTAGIRCAVAVLAHNVGFVPFEQRDKKETEESIAQDPAQSAPNILIFNLFVIATQKWLRII